MRDINQTLNERQQEMLQTCMDSCKNVAYPYMALIEEIGELTEKLRKAIQWSPELNPKQRLVYTHLLYEQEQLSREFREKAKAIRHGSIPVPFSVDTSDMKKIPEICYEIGDVEWDLNVLTHFLGAEAQNIADLNYYKLKNRQRDNTIDANGDHDRTAIE